MARKPKTVISTIEEAQEFFDENEKEILYGVEGQSDGWNQKMTVIDKILKRENKEFDDDLCNSEEFEQAVNSI